MNQLEESRNKIDAIDSELTRLFEERMHAVEGVLIYKASHNMPILDSSREQLIIEKNANRLQDKSLDKYFRDFYQHMMDVSKNYQKDMMKEGK